MSADWRERISQPEYGMIVETNVMVPARDGVRLAIDIRRPDAPGKFPALLGLSPYGKELQAVDMPPQVLGQSAVWDGNIEAGDIEYFVSRGYAHVVGDFRGSGSSEGEWEGHFNATEGEDGYDLVEWLAQQPWCDGNVGMVGRSYFAAAQIKTAIEQPPHLKAIVPVSEFNDFYRDIAYNGGVLGLFLYGLWDGRGGTSGCARNNPISLAYRDMSEAELEERRQALLDDPDIQNYPNLFHLLHYPKKNPAYFDILMYPFDGPYHQSRSTYPGLDKVEVPAYIGGSWGNINAKSCWKTFNGMTGERRMFVNGKTMADRPWREDNDRALRWYDHWLKGNDTGVLDEPPISYFTYGVDEWRGAEEWPLPGTTWTKFYLHCWERLLPEPEAHAEEPDCFLQQPLHLTNKRDSLIYLTPPMRENVTMVGPAVLCLHAAIDQEDTVWMARLTYVDEAGREQNLGKSWLKASHRKLDPEKSEPHQPWHPHTEAEPVMPGEIYEYAIELDPIACVFERGTQLKLEISSMESPMDREIIVHYHHHLCSSRTTLHKVYRNRAHQSHLLLPVVPSA